VLTSRDLGDINPRRLTMKPFCFAPGAARRPVSAIPLALGKQLPSRFADRVQVSKASHVSPRTAPKNINEVEWDNVDWNTFDWREYADEERGPAFLYALQALEWPVVCSHVASFASTSVGKKSCLNLEIARSEGRARVRSRPPLVRKYCNVSPKTRLYLVERTLLSITIIYVVCL
jgi:hypothetical protein